MHHYVILPRLEIAGANAQPCAWLLAPPALTAFQGFAHALALELGAPKHAGFALVHHDIEYMADAISGVLYPYQMRGAQLIDHRDFASATPHILSSQPSARCRLTVSLIVRFDADLALAENRIERFLRGSRIAGGAIQSHRFASRDASLVRSRSHFSSDMVSRLGTGFGVHERADLLEMQPGDRDRLDPFLRTITRPFPRGANARGDASGAHQWILPTTVGYAQITPLAERRQVRQGLKHAFAEPLVGFVEYRPLRKAPPPFWVQSHPASGVYVVSTDPDITSKPKETCK